LIKELELTLLLLNALEDGLENDELFGLIMLLPPKLTFLLLLLLTQTEALLKLLLLLPVSMAVVDPNLTVFTELIFVGSFGLTLSHSLNWISLVSGDFIIASDLYSFFLSILLLLVVEWPITSLLRFLLISSSFEKNSFRIEDTLPPEILGELLSEVDLGWFSIYKKI